MNYPEHSSQTLSKKVNSCSTRLRLFAETDLPQNVDFALMTESFQDLAQYCEQPNTQSLKQLAERICRYLHSRSDAVLSVSALEVKTLNLTASWLEQLSRMHAINLPAPKGLLADLFYSFDLLERVIHAGISAPENGTETENTPTDLFSDDPAPGTTDANSDETLDPFADDPGFGPLFDLLHKTLRRSDLLMKTQITDPFGDDELLAAAKTGDASVTATSRKASPVDDLFADDPQLEDF